MNIVSMATANSASPFRTPRTSWHRYWAHARVSSTLVKTGMLAGESGAYRLVKPVDNLQVPATVQAVLAAGIDRLPPEETRLLQTAAVVGTEVPLALAAGHSRLARDGTLRWSGAPAGS